MLCAKNRDPDSLLCSQCLDGYSESVTTDKCIVCDGGHHWEYWVLSLFMALFIVICYMATNRVNAPESSPTALESTWRITWIYKRLQRSSGDITLYGIFQIVIYYEQGISQLLNGSRTSIFLSAVSGIFDVSAQSVSSEFAMTPWCFIDGLNAKQKVLSDLLAPAFIVLIIGTVFIFSRCFIRKQLRVRNQTVDLNSTMISIFLFLIGRVTATLIQLISCQRIGSERVHFYFGNEECYDVTFAVALIILLSIALVFGSVFVYGRRLTAIELADRNLFIYQLTKRYQPRYWYWEYVLFWRRFIIALFAVGLPGDFWRWILEIILMLFITPQVFLRPFASKEMNRAEFIFLGCLCIVNVAGIRSIEQYSSAASTAVAVVLSIMILIPIPVVTLCAMSTIQRAVNTPRGHSVSDMEFDGDREESERVELAAVSPPSLVERAVVSTTRFIQRQISTSSVNEELLLSESDGESEHNSGDVEAGGSESNLQ